MAVTKIHSITATEVKALTYITNPEKTANGLYVFSYGCDESPALAHKDFEDIRSLGTRKSRVLSEHIIQSFNGQEVTPEQALEIGKELCRRCLKSQNQYVIAVHTDTANPHCHIIFNNTNMINFKTFETLENRWTEKSWKRLQEISDEICKEHGLYVIKHPERSKGKSYYEWDMHRQGISWKTKLKWEIDECVKESHNFDEFLQVCKKHNIEAVYNPAHKIDLKFRMDGQQRFTRARTLGWYYETEQIKKRIDLYHSEFVYHPRTRIIDTGQHKFLDSYGLNRWADIQNMKEASRVINVLTKYQAESEGQLEMAALTEHAHQGSLVNELNDLIRKIDVISDHISMRRVCKKFKPFHEEWEKKSPFFRKGYEKKYSTELTRYNEARATLKAAYPDGKVPTIEELTEQKKLLLQERSQKNDEYKALKATLKEMDFARQTLEDYLKNERDMQERKRKKGTLE